MNNRSVDAYPLFSPISRPLASIRGQLSNFADHACHIVTPAGLVHRRVSHPQIVGQAHPWLAVALGEGWRLPWECPATGAFALQKRQHSTLERLAEIEKKLDDAYAFVFKESVLTIKDTNIDVKFLAPDIAVAHVRWTMTGARTPKGIPATPTRTPTQTLQKQSGKWLIATFQNTNAIPEMPFPKCPPSAPAPTASAHSKRDDDRGHSRRSS
ncbi:MAG TPA: hypothetical protein VGW57_16700 [Chthoniobacterales bacterium]|nr:hypothetical protein [Chthoniobacterales bacterium]